MSLFASKRRTRTEERVLLAELKELLDAREVPSDPWERAKFEAQYARDAMPPAPPPSETRKPQGPVVHQDPLFSEEAA